MIGIRGAIGAAAVTGLSVAMMGLSSKPHTAAFVSDPSPLPPRQVAQVPSISNEAILREINRLREDPSAYADWLETVRQYYDGATLAWPGESSIATAEGASALDNAIQALRQTPARSPLELSVGMSDAASDHIQEVVQQNRFSLVGSDGSTSEDRIERYGIYEGAFQELLTQGLTDPAAIVANLVIDDGDPSRSYRQALLGEQFRYAGIHCEPTGRFAWCITNFAALYTESGMMTETPFGEPIVTGEDPFTQPLTPEILSDLATEIIVETNQARTNPVGYASKLEALRPYYQGTLVKIPGQPAVETIEGISALDEAIADLKSRAPVSALDISLALSQGAADHAQDVGSRGGDGHLGRDGSLPLERASRYGTIPPGSLVGENISFGPPALAEWHVIQLIVDDDVPSRSHREAMLRPEYQLTGSACGSHTIFRIVCVATYASDYDE